MKKALVLLFTMSWLAVFPQVKQIDSVKMLSEVQVTLYSLFPRDLSRATSAQNLINTTDIKNQQQNSLVGIANTAPGVRMEERSPGSYRLSLRGSLLRSPFGIRNVKIYLDEFPLTDAGGNTYLNLIDAGLINSIFILKGPQASIFGANTGGAILVSTNDYLNNSNEIGLTAGSYGLFHQTGKVNRTVKDYSFSIAEGYQQSEGYRENSTLKRKYIQTSHRWQYNERGSLTAFAFYSDLAYLTPGGLTEAQLLANPKLARPATPTLPSAITQQAGIYNKTFFGGLSTNYELTQDLQFVLAAFGNHTDFRNPFITNYEKRKENTMGVRSFISYSKTDGPTSSYNINLGMESSRTSTAFRNYGNDKGTPSALLASDDLDAKQDFAFLKVNVDLNSKLILELGTSLNFFGYRYKSYFPIAIDKQKRSFKTQLMPKFATSYRLIQGLNIRGSIGKGYSPPTIAEVRASDNTINNDLQAEAGWNYETGFNYRTRNNRFTVDGGLFYFHLKNAIVRRLTTNDAEYFVNAGGTKQLGTEIQTSLWILEPQQKKLLDGIKVSSSLTYYHFKFEDFKNAAQDYSGNRLTGVPNYTVVSSLELVSKTRLFLFAQHNYTSAIPLNDANSVYAKKYHLVDLKLGLRQLPLGSTTIEFSVGVNNLFDQDYSLGNDLNAANNRYYNPSAKRNYSVGFGVRL